MRTTFFCLALLLLVACDDPTPPPTDGAVDASSTDAAVSDAGPDAAVVTPAEVCVGIRGNGPRITAHFAALSRITEHYGLPVGGAGGSSASISLFFLESVAMNPLLDTCGAAPCTERERNDRAGLLLKSILGYLQVLATSDEALSFAVLAQIIDEVQTGGVEVLFDTDATAALAALDDILTSPDVQSLVNPEIINLLATSPNPEFHGRDIVASLGAAANFDSSDNTILIRPGVLNFAAFAGLLGRIGSFYAGFAPTDRGTMAAWLDDCAAPGRGMIWPQVAALPSGTSTCGDVFSALVTDFRDRVRADPTFPSRVDDQVGGTLRILVSTSVLQGAAVTEWQAARIDYLSATAHTLDVDFNDIQFGYWGTATDLALVTGNPNGYTDLKTAKATSLGQATWREVLALSPAEPGLARALELPDGRVSAGGWSDLQPTLALQNLGCEKVIYLTRRGAGSTFASGVATLLGADTVAIDQLFSLTDTASSTYVSIDEADAIWCTDWDTPTNTDVLAITTDAFGAPLETADLVFGAIDDPYPGITDRTGFPGCTLGVAAP